MLGPLRGAAERGGYSTVGDMLKFAEALQSGKLLPPALEADATHFETEGKWYVVFWLYPAFPKGKWHG